MSEFEVIATLIGVVWFSFIGLWGMRSGRGH